MRSPRRFVAFLVLGAVSVLVPSLAFAEDKAYDETKTDTGAFVKFKDDPLGANGPSALDSRITGAPRVMRLGLMRPRVQFLPELYKSVENM